MSVRAVAATYGLTKSSVHRHLATCLPRFLGTAFAARVEEVRAAPLDVPVAVEVPRDAPTGQGEGMQAAPEPGTDERNVTPVLDVVVEAAPPPAVAAARTMPQSADALLGELTALKDRLVQMSERHISNPGAYLAICRELTRTSELLIKAALLRPEPAGEGRQLVVFLPAGRDGGAR
jgi:hypothetical protein